MSNLTVQNQWLEDDKIQLLKDTYAKSLNNSQFEVFCHIASKMNLDPIKKEIYGMIVGGRLVTIVGIDGFRKIAHETGDYMGMDPITIVRNIDSNKIMTANCTVYKHVHGEKCAFSATVQFEEYNTGKNNWKSMPETMISKVVESHALRKAFPALSQVYGEEEMGKAIEPNNETDRTSLLTDKFLQKEDDDIPEYVELEPEGEKDGK